ncbi:hypothetical protein TR2A62_1354 [Thalassobium sp. R2A62]|nr:hypothetical protein TR2A62_1354 [Thalassobium sp. R2A62]
MAAGTACVKRETPLRHQPFGGLIILKRGAALGQLVLVVFWALSLLGATSPFSIDEDEP